MKETSDCPPGETLRKGYSRRQYTRKNGKTVASVYIPPKCVKIRGKGRKTYKDKKSSDSSKGSNPKITSNEYKKFVLKKGLLSKYGYHIHLPIEERQDALKKALRENEPLEVFKRLNILYIFNKNKNPKNAKLFKMDSQWVKKNG
jgi:hypothetical protein